MLECPDSRLVKESSNPGKRCKGREPYAELLYVAYKLNNLDEQFFDNRNDSSPSKCDVFISFCPEFNDSNSDDEPNTNVLKTKTVITVYLKVIGLLVLLYQNANVLEVKIASRNPN